MHALESVSLDVKDGELVCILDDCGCGHLFKVCEQPRSRCLAGYAEDMRKYLGFDASPPLR